MKRKTLTALAVLAVVFAAGAFVAPAADAQAPPGCEMHQVYGPSTTFLNIGNAESRALSNLLVEARARGVYERWCGTVWSWRYEPHDVVAVDWVYNVSNRVACRGSYDVIGTNSYSSGVYGHLEWCQSF